jgi:hypothetical protein
MGIQRNVRKGKITSHFALTICTSEKLRRWLKGRIAWEMGRKRTGK